MALCRDAISVERRQRAFPRAEKDKEKEGLLLEEEQID